MLNNSTNVRQRGQTSKSSKSSSKEKSNTNQQGSLSDWLPIIGVIIAFPILYYLISSFVSLSGSTSQNINASQHIIQNPVPILHESDSFPSAGNLNNDIKAAINPITNIDAPANNNDDNNMKAQDKSQLNQAETQKQEKEKEQQKEQVPKHPPLTEEEKVKLEKYKKDKEFAIIHSQDANDDKFVETWQYCHDDCQWRQDNLVGRCFGLWKVKSIDTSKIEVSNSMYLTHDNVYNNYIRKESIDNIADCKQYCCDLGKNCVTFQYHPNKGCFVGGNVRLGLERAGTANWCEPVAPKQWLGQRRIEPSEAEMNNGQWGPRCNYDENDENELKYQCFGLGPEIRGVKDIDSCKKYCCEQGWEKCQLWQFRNDKGCFTGKSGNCDKDNDAWIGARKTLESVGIEF